jgi:hypothetical protein
MPVDARTDIETLRDAGACQRYRRVGNAREKYFVGDHLGFLRPGWPPSKGRCAIAFNIRDLSTEFPYTSYDALVLHIALFMQQTRLPPVQSR